MRLFAVIFGVVAVAGIRVLSFYRNGFPILSSLASFALTMTLFLILITVIDRLKVIKLFVKNNINKIIAEDAKENDTHGPLQHELVQHELVQQELVQQELLEIKKETVAQTHEAGVSLEKRVYAGVYIASFLGIAIWRIIVLFKVMPWAYAGQYRAGIVDAVLLLVLPCVAVSCLKMRKDGSPHSIDTISRDMLMLFAYTSCIYAAVIAASSVLKINFMVVLPLVYYAVTLYLVFSLAVNIALSMLKGDILSFDYTLFPRLFPKAAPTQTAKWNVSLKSLYTIKYTLTILPALALALIFLLILSTTIFVVQPHQQAAVYHFGNLTVPP